MGSRRRWRPVDRLDASLRWHDGLGLMPKEVTSFSNPLVKQARGLREKKNRRAEGLFLAEGLRILTEAREAGRLPERIFFSDGSHKLIQALIDAVEAAGGDAVETSEDILHKISGKENPQAVV